MRNCVYLKILFVLLLFVTKTNCNANGNFAIEKDTIVPKKQLNKNSSLLKTAGIAPEIYTTPNPDPYCPGSYTKIVSTATLIDPGNVISEIYIQISNGYLNGQDKLSLDNPSSHPTIESSPFDATTGKFKLYKTGASTTLADFEAAIEDLVFYNSSISPSGIRKFSISIGNANYLPSTQHYYEFIPSTAITWTAAKLAAESKKYYGLQGYLATVTSMDEVQITGEQATGSGWIGGSDEAVDDIWQWVTGPENGTVFWNGKANGSSPNFAYWNTDEPNDYESSGEKYAHITAPGVGIKGSWNDMTNTGDNSGYAVNGVPYAYQAKGYSIEYGGMPLDPIIHVSAITVLTISEITSTASTPICGSGSINLSAVASTGNVYWYDASGNLLTPTPTNTFTTPNITTTTTYFADAGCPSSRKAVIAKVNPLPIVNLIEIIQCSENSSFYSTFNLTVKNDAISSDSTNENFTYYSSPTDANNDTNKITDPIRFINKSPNETVWVRVANKISGCFSIATIDLKVSVTQLDPNFHKNLEMCDDALLNDQDGFSEFDFHTVTADIQNEIDPLSNNTYSIKYYTTKDDALSEINEILNPSNFRNTIKDKQDIWVRIDNDLDNSCFGIGAYVTLFVNPVPNINMNTNGAEDTWVCDNDPNYFITITAGIQASSTPSDYNYIWKMNGNPVGTNSATLDVYEKGVYTVEVTNKSSGCSRTRTITVKPSNSATLLPFKIVDLTDANSVTVMVTGPGEYEYSLDEPTGPWQNSTVFDNVSAGIHNVYINDKNGCGVVSETIAIIGAPKFFTPNNDGYNDYWNIEGINGTFNSKSIIYIFDRYGKLIKQWIPTLNQGWDGTFNGIPLTADDYWYTLKLENSREAKGHFSLKR